jgi:hypothetical protein
MAVAYGRPSVPYHADSTTAHFGAAVGRQPVDRDLILAILAALAEGRHRGELLCYGAVGLSYATYAEGIACSVPYTWPSGGTAVGWLALAQGPHQRRFPPGSPQCAAAGRGHTSRLHTSRSLPPATPNRCLPILLCHPSLCFLPPACALCLASLVWPSYFLPFLLCAVPCLRDFF